MMYMNILHKHECIYIVFDIHLYHKTHFTHLSPDGGHVASQHTYCNSFIALPVSTCHTGHKHVDSTVLGTNILLISLYFLLQYCFNVHNPIERARKSTRWQPRGIIRRKKIRHTRNFLYVKKS